MASNCGNVAKPCRTIRVVHQAVIHQTVKPESVGQRGWGQVQSDTPAICVFNMFFLLLILINDFNQLRGGGVPLTKVGRFAGGLV